MITETDAFAAMCLWEAWLEMTSSMRSPVVAESGTVVCKMRDMQDSQGAWAIRSYLLGLAPRCNEAWEVADKLEDQGSFDWDFVPAFLHGVIESDTLLDGTAVR